MIPYKKSAYRLLHEGGVALGEVEQNGIQIDTNYLKNTIKKTKKHIAELQNELDNSKIARTWRKVYGKKTNFQSNVQLGNLIFKHLEIAEPVYTENSMNLPKNKRRFRTDETTLMNIEDPFVAKYFEIKKLKKASRTYLRGIQKEVVDDLLHPFFNLHIARTFRSSSDSPNFQNVPVRDKEIGKLIRQAFIAREGNHFVEIDYSGIEVRVAATYHKDPNMINYIKNPEKDMHRDMAVECYKLLPEQVTKEIRFYGKNCFVFPQFYGSIYTDCSRALWEAIDTAKLVTSDGIPLKDHLRSKGIRRLGTCDPRIDAEKGTFEKYIAQVQKSFWKDRFSRYAKWKKEWYYKYMERGWMLTKTGFICQGFMRQNNIINYPVQGSAFHCLLWSLIHLQKEVKKHKMKALIIGQIHDSILADVPADELQDFLVLANHVMTKQLVKEWKWINVPLEVEAEVCPVGGSWNDKKEMEIPK